MNMIPVNRVTGGRRAWSGLLVFFLLSATAGCSSWSPRQENREDMLRNDLRGFHWALVGQDTHVALRYVRSEERDSWDTFLSCLLKEFRLVDFRLERITFREDSEEAAVRVLWTGHLMHSLVVRDIVWREEWVFDSGKQKWFLQPTGEAIDGLPEKCRPPSLD